MSRFDAFAPPKATVADVEQPKIPGLFKGLLIAFFVLTVLGDVYDRACARFCSRKVSPDCDAMAERIFAAAMNGERDPDRLWRIAVRGSSPLR